MVVEYFSETKGKEIKIEQGKDAEKRMGTWKEGSLGRESEISMMKKRKSLIFKTLRPQHDLLLPLYSFLYVNYL